MSSSAGLSLLDVQRFSEADALEYFRRARWPETFGGAVCACGSEDTFRHANRPAYRCKRCKCDFSEWSDTPFASRKLPARDLLVFIATFATSRKGISSLQISKDTAVNQRTAFVILHKLRELMVAEQAQIRLSGVVEIDGAVFGGYRRQENVHSGRFEKRMTVKHFENRRVLVVARQRGGRTLTFVGKKESCSVEALARQLVPGTIVQADGAHAWDSMKEAYEMLRIEHSFAYAANDACTNNAESFFSMMRRQQRGTHHKISGDLLYAYAAEMAWRQDHRLLNAESLIEGLTKMVMNGSASYRWSGYWQKVPGKQKEATSTESVEVSVPTQSVEVAA